MEMNQQRIEKMVYTSDGSLDVHSIFTTIQGEGPHAGRSAVFIRLAGCNLQCSLCDTDYTTGRRMMKVEDIVLEVYKRSSSGLIVITGGEPFRQVLRPLISGLQVAGNYIIQIETNGTLCERDLPFGTELVISPKAGKLAQAIYDQPKAVSAFKYVLKADDIVESDGLPRRALDHPASPMVARPPEWVSNRKVYVQPADEQDPVANRRNLEACIAAVHKFGYTLSIQQHKIIGLP